MQGSSIGCTRTMKEDWVRTHSPNWVFRRIWRRLTAPWFGVTTAKRISSAEPCIGGNQYHLLYLWYSTGDDELMSFHCRYDEEAGNVELDYPRDMSMWKGVPYNIDSVFQYTNGTLAWWQLHLINNLEYSFKPLPGKTYFFKGKVFWEFNDRRMRVVSSTPSVSSSFWMGCNIGMETLQGLTGEERLELPSSGAPCFSINPCTVLLIIVFYLFNWTLDDQDFDLHT